jgi:hypothetical protein
MRKIKGLAFAAAAALAVIALAGEMDRTAKAECNRQIAALNNRLSMARAHTADERARLSQTEAVIKDLDASGTIEARDIRNSTHQELVRNACSYRSDLEIAKKNEAELERQLSAIIARAEGRLDRLFCACASDVGLRLRRPQKLSCGFMPGG